MTVTYLGVALFIGAMIASQAFRMPAWVWVLGLAGFAVAWLTTAGTYVVGIRCPHCGGRLTVLVMQKGGFRLDPRVHFCPYCGQDVDADYQEATDAA